MSHKKIFGEIMFHFGELKTLDHKRQIISYMQKTLSQQQDATGIVGLNELHQKKYQEPVLVKTLKNTTTKEGAIVEVEITTRFGKFQGKGPRKSKAVEKAANKAFKSLNKS